MQLSWIKVLSSGFALVCATAGATWYVRGDRIQNLQDQLAAYQAVQGSNLPALIKELGAIAGKADAAIRLRDLETQFSEFRKRCEAVSALNQALLQKTKLEEEFTLTRGQSHSVINGKIVIGIIDISETNAFVKYDNAYYTEEWDVGAYKDVSFAGTEYRIILSETIKKDGNSPGKAIFRVMRSESPAR